MVARGQAGAALPHGGGVGGGVTTAFPNLFGQVETPQMTLS